MKPTTESVSNHQQLENMDIGHLLAAINYEDKTVANALEQALPQIEALVKPVVTHLQRGGRLFYVGAGTSGRLGIVDASEIPPTYGVENKVIGLIAGGDEAIRCAVERAEDNQKEGWRSLCQHDINNNDIVVGLSASGGTPYVVGTLQDAQKNGITTGCITCNHHTALARYADFPIAIIVGPEFVTGSTRMKAGTAQKMALNMISTCTMIKLGHVRDNKMIDMRLHNDKLLHRGIVMVAEALKVTNAKARQLLDRHGNVREAIDAHQHTSDKNK